MRTMLEIQMSYRICKFIKSVVSISILRRKKRNYDEANGKRVLDLFESYR